MYIPVTCTLITVTSDSHNEGADSTPPSLLLNIEL